MGHFDRILFVTLMQRWLPGSAGFLATLTSYYLIKLVYEILVGHPLPRSPRVMNGLSQDLSNLSLAQVVS